MLQDVEAGRSLEIEGLMNAILELGRLTNTPTPYVGAIYACVKLLDQTLAGSGARLRAEPAGVEDPVA